VFATRSVPRCYKHCDLVDRMCREIFLEVVHSGRVSQSRVAVTEARGEFENPEEGKVCRWKPLSQDC
jgi:hypothetical protein